MKMASATRIQWIDSAKLVGIFLVVLGHLSFHNRAVNNVIYSFHMPLFFFLSGLTARKEPLKETVRRSINTLLVPYFCFYLVNLGKTCFWRPERVDGGFAKAVLGMFLGVGFDTAFSIMIVPPLWFLAGLFCCKILYSSTRSVCGPFEKTMQFVFCVAFVSVAVFLNTTQRFLPFSLGPAFLAYPFFAVGNVFSPKIISTLENNVGLGKKCILIAILLFALAADVLLTSVNGPTDVNLIVYGKSPILFFATAFSGITAVVALSTIIKLPSFLNLLARNTVVILAFHSMMTKMMLIPLTKIGLAQMTSDKKFLMPSLSIALLVATVALLLSYFPITIINKFCPWMLGRKKEI